MPRREPQETPQEEPPFPKPWYYRPEYMIPMFIFWPAWPVLVLRSPWNNNVILGGVAWAVLFIGAVMGFKWLQAGSYQPIMTFYVPGVLLTIYTQVQWTRYRHEMAGDVEAAGQESGESASPDGPPRPSARRRRRSPRAGRSKG